MDMEIPCYTMNTTVYTGFSACLIEKCAKKLNQPDFLMM